MKRSLYYLGLFLFTACVFAQDKQDIKKFCAKRCFYYCKFREQAVSDCEIYNVTPISFQLKCNCRDFEAKEELPAYPPNYLINTKASLRP